MLDAFFNPASVAVIGASTTPAKLGHAVMRNLVDGGFADNGVIYPINPKSPDVLGHKAYKSVLDVPGDIDQAVIVIPCAYVPDALRECGKKGIKAVVIISAGFRELGMSGLELEYEIIDIAKEYGIRMIGPNCLGIIDTFAPLNASFAAGTPPRGPLGFMSQSGALGTAVLDVAMGGGLGMSKFVSLGNKADVSEIDLLKAWADDDNTKVIMIYSEGMPDGQEFIRVAREVTRKKPVVAIKSGVTQAGARAVSSHTGSLAGSEQAYQAAFEQAGVIRATSLTEMFDYSIALGYLPTLQGNQIGIVTNAGGPGILATDALERSGLSLAQLEIETVQTLETRLPDAASAANPVDVLGDARADRYEFAMQLVVDDPNVDALLVILTPQAMTEIEATANALCKIAGSSGKPVMGCFMGAAMANAGVRILEACGVPNYSSPERAAMALRGMADYREIVNRPLRETANVDIDKAGVQAVLDRVRREGRASIGDAEARDIMTAIGLRIPRSQLAETADEAVKLAADIGYPVVLKIASPDILHKTDVGGVKVGLDSASDVRDAFDLIMYRAQRYVPDARLWGCLVQEMVPKGIEVLVGMNRDPQFGPLVTFGLGGIYVETLKDVTFRIAPFAEEEARAMLDEIRAHALLDGVRGAPPADKDALVDVLLRIGQLVRDFPEIAELDINPVVVYDDGQGAVSIDMRLVLT